MAVPHSTSAATPHLALRTGPEAKVVRTVLASARARELATVLQHSDPMRATFDVAVRRFVRAERADGGDLDTILASIAAILRTHVEPSLPPERRGALQHAIAWFTVSEYHRAD